MATVGDCRGAGPRGMWWVAWRQHRLQLLIALAVLVVVAAAVLLFQLVLIARLHAVGCTVLTHPNACTNSLAAQNSFNEGAWRILRAVLVASPVVVGVFVGAPMFPREFDQRAEVFALTQSVGRIRWWSAKIIVAGTPLVAGLLGLGFLVQWVDATTSYTDRNAFDDGTFQVQTIMLAAFGLLALAIAITVGILVRSVVGALVTGLIVAGGVVVILAFPLRSHLLPITRDVTPFEAAIGSAQPVAAGTGGVDDPDNWFLGSGLLGPDGRPIPFYDAPCQDISITVADGQQPTAQQIAAYSNAMTKCQKEHGTRQYTDYVPAVMLWPLRGVVTGICLVLAGLFLALGAFRLRARAGSRS